MANADQQVFTPEELKQIKMHEMLMAEQTLRSSNNRSAAANARAQADAAASRADANMRAQASLDQREKENLRATALARQKHLDSMALTREKSAREGEILAKRAEQERIMNEMKMGGKKRIDAFKARGSDPIHWGSVFKWVDRADPNYLDQQHVPKR